MEDTENNIEEKEQKESKKEIGNNQKAMEKSFQNQPWRQELKKTLKDQGRLNMVQKKLSVLEKELRFVITLYYK